MVTPRTQKGVKMEQQRGSSSKGCRGLKIIIFLVSGSPAPFLSRIRASWICRPRRQNCDIFVKRCKTSQPNQQLTRPFSAAAWPLVIKRQRLPQLGLSTLNSMAFGLAVYASQRRLPDDHAKLASSCWSSSTGRASHPQGSDERFQSCNLHLILLSQAFLAQLMQPQRVSPRAKSQRCWHRC